MERKKILFITEVLLTICLCLGGSNAEKLKNKVYDHDSLHLEPIVLEYSGENSVLSCSDWTCPRGQRCFHGKDGVPKCDCIKKCRRKLKPVCGTDGKVYRNHCELYRQACLTKSSSLWTDHTSSSCNMFIQHGDTQPLDRSPSSSEDSRRVGVGGKVRRMNKKKKSSSLEMLRDDQVRSSQVDWFDQNSNELSSREPLTYEYNSLTKSWEQRQGNGNVVLSDAQMNWNDKKSVVHTQIMSQDASNSCSSQEYEILKDELLLFSHERLIGGLHNFKVALESKKSQTTSKFRRIGHDGSTRFGDGPEASKEYLLSLMFSKFDHNNNGMLDESELEEIDEEEKSTKVESTDASCSVVDLLRFDDSDHNGQLDINEFYAAFNKLYSVSVISLDKSLETKEITAVEGDKLRIPCDVSASPPTSVTWERYDLKMSSLIKEDDIQIDPDGSIIISNVKMFHSGNYTCHAERNHDVIQTVKLTVQSPPKVKVVPELIWERQGKNVSVECFVTGEPFPTVQWLKNDEPIDETDEKKYKIIGNGRQLVIKNTYFSDTGAYMCKGENSAGKRLGVSSLVILDKETPSPTDRLDMSKEFKTSMLAVFHDKGISIYDASTCRLQLQMLNTMTLPESQGLLCGESSTKCSWGRVTNVGDDFMYISQPTMDRVIVLSVKEFDVIDVVTTDRYPVELYYVENVDQVWVECWRRETSDSEKTLQVIRDASINTKHHTVHPEPINSHFDLVEKIFVGKNLKSSEQFRYGYVSHKNGRGVYKMDLMALRYTKRIDLTPYNCVPKEMEFCPLYGTVVVECIEPVTKRPTGQLLLDSLTDSVIFHERDLYGKPYISPDSRKLITFSHASNDLNDNRVDDSSPSRYNSDEPSTTLLVQHLSENGPAFVFDVNVSMNLSCLTFFPSQHSHSYDVFMTASNRVELLYVNIDTGKVKVISTLGAASSSSNRKSIRWNNPERSIVSQNDFGKYIATHTTDSVIILNGKTKQVSCEIGGVSNVQLLSWVQT